MIRARKLANVHQKRSCRPLYAHTSAVPFAAFIDTSVVLSTTVIFPGMVACKTTGEQVKLAVASADHPFGLFANFINGDFDELGDSTECSVWRGGPDAEFEILGDALESRTWTGDDGTTAGVLLYHSSNGKLTNNAGAPSTTQRPVARLISAPSNSKIIVTLELGYAAAVPVAAIV